MSPLLPVNILPITFAILLLPTTSTSATQSSSAPFSCANLTATCICQSSRDPITKYEVDCMNIVPQNNPYISVFYTLEGKLKLNCYPATRNNLNIGATMDEEEAEYELALKSNPLSLLPNVEILLAEEVFMSYCNVTGWIPTIEEVLAKAMPSRVTLQYLTFENGDFRIHDNFKGLTNISYLSLQHNNLGEIPYGFLSRMPSLEKVFMNFNELHSVHGSFNENLQVLEFGSNNISYIHPDAFKGLRKLNVLHLWGNSINDLPDGIFDDLESLDSLELSRNFLTQVSADLFAKIPLLGKINLGYNQLTNLPESIFWNNELLTSIRLEKNKLSRLPSRMFKKCPDLTMLTLQHNNLNYLDDAMFEGLTKLDSLNLEGNHLTDLSAVLLAPMAKLTILKLGNNDIEEIDVAAFVKLDELIDLDLSNNHLKHLALTTFVNQNVLQRLNVAKNEILIENPDEPTFANFLESLEELDVGYNRLDAIPLDFLNTKSKLNRLIAVNNMLTSFDFETIQGAISNVEIDVSSNQISTIDNMADVMLRDRQDPATSHFKKKLIIDHNPIVCNGSNYDLFRYFTGELDKNFQTTYDIKPEKIVCAAPPEMVGMPFTMRNPCLLSYSISTCPENCECYHVPLDNIATVDCRGMNLTSVPRLFAPSDEDYKITRHHCHVGLKDAPVVKVILKENRIRHLQSTSFNEISVSILDVSFNNLSAVSWVPHGLKSLMLDHNDLSRINKTLLENLHNVTLDHNPWICDCETVPFWIYLTDNIIPNKIDVRCFDNNKTIRLLSRESLCPSYAKLIITLVVVAAVLVLIPAIFLIFFYKYKQEIKVWLFAHNMCLWFVREEDLDKDKLYDAFVSFSHKDEDFVVDQLMPRLENIPNPYKLCVHMRNFVPGEFIAKQVADSVLNSRRTIVVLSPSFLDSVWGKMEFRAAHTSAITEGIARVIIIIYDDLDLNDERIDDELRVYLKTNTYIKWGDPWFWDKLKYALPHRKGGEATYTNKKFDNITVNIDKMDQIDQKLDQNINVNIINGNNSTIDTLLMKGKTEGLFNPICANDTPPAEKGIV